MLNFILILHENLIKHNITALPYCFLLYSSLWNVVPYWEVLERLFFFVLECSLFKVCSISNESLSIGDVVNLQL